MPSFDLLFRLTVLVSVGAVCNTSNYFILLTGSVLKWAETNLTTQSVMVTGLALGSYRHMDLVDEVWPYFVEKDISRVYYCVVILPLQRRVRTHTHKLFGCHASHYYYYVLASCPPFFFRLASFPSSNVSSYLSFSSFTSTPPLHLFPPPLSSPPPVSSSLLLLLLSRFQAFIHFDDALKCKEFVSDFLHKPFTIGGSDLTLHFLLDHLKPCTSEV